MKVLWLGIDVGSTTVKAVVVQPQDGKILSSTYRRHGARQTVEAGILIQETAAQFPGVRFHIAVCGSGGKPLADALDVHYIQEVVANSLAVRRGFPRTRTAIELGGQDAKIIFFHHDSVTDKLVASDMRMNGSCAGGTGAFIDEVAALLHIPVEDFDGAAARGTQVYDISGRCGVFAKTDIQPLLNQGVSKDDIALSTFHAIAKQTIGGLAQGLEIQAPIIFEGGPLSFQKTLVRVFCERLGLGGQDILLPEEPQTLVAWGAALSLENAGSRVVELEEIPSLLGHHLKNRDTGAGRESLPFFANPEEWEDFQARHGVSMASQPMAPPGTTLDLWIGVDGGSTTSKSVALDQENRVRGTWYSPNRGQPLDVMKSLLLDLERHFTSQGVTPRIRGIGTTGYGEMLFAQAFGADYHTVETVSHSAAALHFVPGASFVLDIGGQDMKAILIQNDIVTGIVLNEACSAGCGSFLENFATNLKIPVGTISQRAFASKSPSILGSRCTVFMNSSIITEQKNGKTPEDIMAGLCRSIVENVFTKVMRVSNFDSLGPVIVVQGGTFRNDAVLRALEQYTERKVVRAPYPGEMGAIGIALLVKEKQEKEPGQPTKFIGFRALDTFSFTQESGLVCPLCTNNCLRTVVRFPTGGTFVTGNRCERGEDLEARPTQVGEPKAKKITGTPDLVARRSALLFGPHPFTLVSPAKDMTIGIPRVLEFWDSLPFWKTFFQSLGYRVEVSGPSTQKLFQSGLQNVSSDTVCFPAKIVHGHIRDLALKKVDRIFMPMQNRLPLENPTSPGTHMCAVVKGYPLVVRYSDDPTRRWGVAFDHPMFHWLTDADRDSQLTVWARETLNLPESVVMGAIHQGDSALKAFRQKLTALGQEVLDSLDTPGGPDFAVVLAGRPYQTDPLVGHDLPTFFRQKGIPVLTLDCLPGLNEVDLSKTRVELTNPFHSRMYAGALIAARHPKLELVQVVSFGCGHDAVLSDEIIRLMQNTGGKTPLVLKLDESDVKGPLNIRIRSFIETVQSRRSRGLPPVKELTAPYEVKFTRKDRKEKTILIPNVTPAWSTMIGGAIASEGYRVESMPLADHKAILLGKQFIHNDMCYPAQVNVGEMLGALKSGKYDPDKVVCGLAKSPCDCRLAHYAALARTALDTAGYPQVPIITTDKDNKGMHPAFQLGMKFQLRAMWGLNMVDVLEQLVRRLRPYELVKGQADEIFQTGIQRISGALRTSTRRALKEFEGVLLQLATLPADLSGRRPRVFVIGEFLLNFHPTSNMNIEAYLEDHGMEAVLPATFTPIHRDYIKYEAETKVFSVRYPWLDVFANDVTLALIARVQKKLDAMARRIVPFYVSPMDIRDLAALSDPIIHHTFTPGEGWLIAAEILHHASEGIHSFIILQPFGCLPNHIVGRGLVKVLKEKYPRIQILPLDFDPDTSFANIENRLQMLIISAKEMDKPQEISTGS